MSKVIMDNVKITAKSGGTLKNVDLIVKNSEFTFSESSFDVSTDESVAIVQELIKSGMQDQLVAVIRALKESSPEHHQEIVSKSFLSKYRPTLKDVGALILLLLSLAKQLP